ASSGLDNTLRLWDLQGNPIGPPFRGHDRQVWSIAFSPDGDRIVSSSFDGTLRLWWATWRAWLRNSCNRLATHPTLQAPGDSYDGAFRQVAAEVKAACDNRIWERPED
ncbi:MAG: hypothetical protein AAF635_16475, partial [Cyanobacteria bacterium P01_C01_bin.69]